MLRRVPKCLVTGANGVLGRALLTRLRDEDDTRVVAAVRSERAAERVRELGMDVEIAMVPEPSVSVGDALVGVDVVAHTVGILKESATNRYVDAHEGSIRALCEGAERADCRRVVYLSIVGADPESPNPCLASKGRAEAILLERLPGSLVLRLPMVLGGGDPASAALRARARAGRTRLLGGGHARDQPIDVRDAAAAISAALRKPEVCGALDLAGPEALPHRVLLLRVAERLGTSPSIGTVPVALARGVAWIAERLTRDPPVTVAMLDVLLQDDALDSSDAWAALGLSPRPLDESLDHWFKKEDG